MSALACLALCVLASPAMANAAAEPGTLLPEGAALQSLDGTLARADGNDTWLFEFSDDVNDAGVYVPAGTRLELLPSGTLAQMIADANERLLAQYRIAAQVTCYRGRNFLLASYFLPLSKFRDANEPAQPQTQATPGATQAGRSNGALAIPDEALTLLHSRRPVRGPQRPGSATGAALPTSRPMRVLVNVDGFIEAHQGRLSFVPDGFGWNVSKVRYELLPSSMLEQAQALMAASPNRIRFSVAGLVTEFKGAKYLILQRVARVYNYGNFGG